jgi:hypothetical protein
MTIFPPQDIADRIGLNADGITVIEAKIIWSRRDPYTCWIEALVEIEIAYRTDEALVVLRHRVLVNTGISRIGGTRARLVRAAALLTATTRGPATPERRPAPLAA